MAAEYTNVLELLGKQVSFLYVLKNELVEYPLHYSGVVTSVVIHLDAPAEISVDDGDYFTFDKLQQFTING